MQIFILIALSLLLTSLLFIFSSLGTILLRQKDIMKDLESLKEPKTVEIKYPVEQIMKISEAVDAMNQRSSWNFYLNVMLAMTSTYYLTAIEQTYEEAGCLDDESAKKVIELRKRLNEAISEITNGKYTEK